jgi:tRNA(Ile)-lysidine synthase
MDGQSMKLQDFFVNVKLPERARRNWPIVCSKGNIAWVPGYRIAHPLRVTRKTKRVLKLQMKNKCK